MALAIRTRFVKLTLLSPRSTAPIQVRWTPTISAKPSRDHRFLRRSSRIRCPSAKRDSCTFQELAFACVWVYSVWIGIVCVTDKRGPDHAYTEEKRRIEDEERKRSLRSSTAPRSGQSYSKVWPQERLRQVHRQSQGSHGTLQWRLASCSFFFCWLCSWLLAVASRRPISQMRQAAGEFTPCPSGNKRPTTGMK